MSDWIKMRTDLTEDPAVIGIAKSLSLEEDTVVGKLLRLWGWASEQTTDGNAPNVTKKWIDRYVGAEGFAEAMAKEHWLEIKETGVAFPNFDRHMSQSAKTRALTAERIRKMRQRECNGTNVTEALPEEKRKDKNYHDDDEIKVFLSSKGVQLHPKVLSGIQRMNGNLQAVQELWRGIVNGKTKNRPAALARAVMDYQ